MLIQVVLLNSRLESFSLAWDTFENQIFIMYICNIAILKNEIFISTLILFYQILTIFNNISRNQTWGVFFYQAILILE